MLRFILLCFCISFSLLLSAQDEFITTWRTTTVNESITIPDNSSEGPYFYSVDWGDGTNNLGVTDGITHVYSMPGDYQVSILGDFPALDLAVGGGAVNAEKLISMDQWGNQKWKTLDFMFQDAKNMVYNATDVPNLNNVTSAIGTFYNCELFNGAIGNWDVSKITNMGSMFGGTIFNGTKSFDQDLGNWDIDQVTNMSNMLTYSGMSRDNYDNTLIGWIGQYSLQNPLAGRTLGVNDLVYCEGEVSRNALILLGWTIIGDSKDCPEPFITEWKTNSAGETLVIPTNPNYTYNYDVDWDSDGTYDKFGLTGDATYDFDAVGVYKVTIRGDFPAIYLNDGPSAPKLERIIQWGDIEWKSMQDAFKGAINMTYHATDLPDLANVTSLAGMFYDCTSLNQPLGTWNTSQITEMHFMFNGASTFNQSLLNWNTSQVTNMNFMFNGATAFNKNISIWNTAKVTSMQSMFKGATFFNQDLSDWDVFNVTTMDRMFYQASAFDFSLGDWEIRLVDRMDDMLSESGMSIANYDATLAGWESFGSGQGSLIQGVSLGAIGLEYCNSTSERDILIDNFDWEIDGDSECFENYQPFITKWEDVGLFKIDTLGPYNYNYAVDWENDGVIDARSITGDISHTYASGAHEIAIYGEFPAFKIEVSKRNNLLEIMQWGDISWRTMKDAFAGTTMMTYSATDTPDLSNATDISGMFDGCVLFNGAIGGWDVGSITDMSSMLEGAAVFDHSLGSFNISSVSDMTNMLSGSGLSQVSYDTTLIGWAQNSVIPSGITMGASGLSYCDGEDARTELVADYNWDIVGDDWGCPVSQAFITTWRTTNAEESITILTNSDYTYNYNVDWENDGTIDDYNVTGDLSHTYPLPGNYQVAIYGNFPHFLAKRFSNLNSQLIDINQWGSIEWLSMTESFENCFNLEYSATDLPDLSQVDDLNETFHVCNRFNGDVGGWDVSNITSMQRTFSNARLFNQDLNDWDVRNVRDMSFMFQDAQRFNKPLNKWKTDMATNLTFMFAQTHAFNQSLDSLNVSNVTDMSFMFSGATAFNKPLNGWKTNSVTNMSYMFGNAVSFNQSLDSLNVTNVTHMTGMFSRTQAFNKPLTGWNTENVRDMSDMFSQTDAFNQDLVSWDVSNVRDMSRMFSSSEVFNKPLDGWKTDSVTLMAEMFSNAAAFNQNLDSLNVSNVTDMSGMFDGTEAFNKPLNNWNTENVTNMTGMFSYSVAFDQALDSLDVSNVQSLTRMLSNTNISEANYDATLISWASQDVTSGVTLGARGLSYCAAVLARQSLIDDGWTFDGDYECGTSAPCFGSVTNSNHSISSNSWNTDANWSQGRIPDGCDHVTFDLEIGVPKEVTVDTDGICSTLEVPVGMSLVVDGFTLTVTPVEVIDGKGDDDDDNNDEQENDDEDQ